jgi:hypothetical protein
MALIVLVSVECLRCDTVVLVGAESPLFMTLEVLGRVEYSAVVTLYLFITLVEMSTI